MSDILVEVRGRVVVASFNRPERLNACRRVTYEALLEVAKRLATVSAWRAMVLTGTGRAFSTGQDLDEIEAGPMTTEEIERALQLLQDITRYMLAAGKPLVAAINGPAVGFGAEVALACDLRVATDSAWFMLPELKHGLFHSNGTYHYLPRIAGPGLAADMILTSRRVEAAEALRAGIVSRVLPTAQMLPAAIEAAESMAALDEAALRLARDGLQRSSDMSVAEALEFETSACRRLLSAARR